MVVEYEKLLPESEVVKKLEKVNHDSGTLLDRALETVTQIKSHKDFRIRERREQCGDRRGPLCQVLPLKPTFLYVRDIPFLFRFAVTGGAGW